MKKWVVLPEPSVEFVNAHPELPEVIVRLLSKRGLTTQTQIDEFLNPDYSRDLHDPFLFRDMEKALALLQQALDEKWRIVVHGDYDADGVCASTILVKTLRKLGADQISVFLPHRETDGYGLNINTVNKLHTEGTQLIITCDCGISNKKEVELAHNLGIKVIITDHHTIPAELPPADAIIHPLVAGETYPDKGLAGGGVAFKLAQALLKRHQQTTPLLPDGQTHEAFEKWLLDLVALSTIGDMVPLLGESRTLTRYGLTVLNKTRNVGLKELLKVANITDEAGEMKHGGCTTTTVGFQIVPRINAAGRMDHANVASMLLLAEDESEARQLAEQLNQNNVDRQKLTEKLTAEAHQQIKAAHQEENPVLFVIGENFPTGVVGLIAGRIKDAYSRPAIVMGIHNGEITGSGRSIKEFNMIRALQEMPDVFAKFGGHPQACGFTLASPDHLEDFKKRLSAKAATATEHTDLTPTILIDAEIDLDLVDWKLYDLLQKFEPFGMANEEPKYLAQKLKIVDVVPVGQDGKHLRLMVKHNSHLIKKTIGFGLGDPSRHPEKWREALQIGDTIDMVFSIGVNEWNGNRELQLMIEDIRRST